MENLYQSIMTKNLAYTENRWIVPQGVFLHSTGAGNPMLKRYVQPDDGRLGYNRYQAGFFMQPPAPAGFLMGGKHHGIDDSGTAYRKSEGSAKDKHSLHVGYLRPPVNE